MQRNPPVIGGFLDRGVFTISREGLINKVSSTAIPANQPFSQHKSFVSKKCMLECRSLPLKLLVPIRYAHYLFATLTTYSLRSLPHSVRLGFALLLQLLYIHN